ncbi:hypothetical protein [Caloranaerobacter azorensis]|uniref:Uncharacterized protein n=1 Tax=Caloranaerobacter azorensis TaxID=116090 RepID=A0A6P1YD77_9FIRM|nr:hypothetical protein [Caloranaerobacter azorensis]QIB26862.1 hypothetical protein G3A45_05890 [Caloranaerobacter azorensis]
MYSFKDLKKDLLVGREIEFKYNGELYSISNSSKGWALCHNNAIIGNYFEDINYLINYIEQVKIGNKYFREIFEQNEYESLYIL